MSELQKPSLKVRHLSAFLLHVSAIGAIIAAATANSRRLSQQNPFKTCVRFIGRASPNLSSVYSTFRKNHRKMFPRYWPAFVPTKSLQKLCFIGRAWPNFPSYYSTFQKNPSKKIPQVWASCRRWDEFVRHSIVEMFS